MESFVLDSEGPLTGQIILEGLYLFLLRLDYQPLLLGAILVVGLLKNPLIQFLPQLLAFLLLH